MLLASFFFASMGVCVKLASSHFNAFELVFYRGIVSALLMVWLMRARGTPLATPVLGAQARRSLVGVVSLAAWFYAIGHLPLATAMTLNYMSSIWLGAFIVGGGWLFGRVVAGQGALVGAVLASFAGVVMILQPTLEQNQLFAGLMGLLSGLMAALAYLQVMALSRQSEPTERTVFYFAVACAFGGALGMAVGGISIWNWSASVWLLPVGIFATGGQWCMTRAYSDGATLVVANLQYSGIVFGALFSLLLFGDHIPLTGWLGMLIIIASGIMATVLRAQVMPRAPAEDH